MKSLIYIVELKPIGGVKSFSQEVINGMLTYFTILGGSQKRVVRYAN